MSTEQNITLEKINELNFNSSQIGTDINEAFRNIDYNFKSIIQSEYLKGATGDSINIVEYDFDEEDQEEEVYVLEGGQLTLLTTEELKKQIQGCILSDITDINVKDIDQQRIELEGRISLLCQKNGGKNVMQSALPYIFIDTQYLDHVSPITTNIDDSTPPCPNQDLSCIIYFQNNSFHKSLSFPQLYYDTDRNDLCWKINGVETKIIAKGPRGEKGSAGKDGTIYFTKYKKNGETYIVTALFDLMNNVWIVFDENTDGDVLSQWSGCITLSVKDSNQNQSNENDSSDSLEEDLKVGVLQYNDNDNEGEKGLVIRDAAGLAVSLSELMGNNTSGQLFIPMEFIGEYTNTNKYYHVLQDRFAPGATDSGESGDSYLEIGVGKTTKDQKISILNIDDLKQDITEKNLPNCNYINKYKDVHYEGDIHYKGNFHYGEGVVQSGVLKSNYKPGDDTTGCIIADELSYKPVLQSNGEATETTIKVTVGAQTSDPFTVPFSTNSTTAEFIGNETVGSPATPVYIKDGTPTSISIPTGDSTTDPLLTIDSAKGQQIHKTSDNIYVDHTTETLYSPKFDGYLIGTADDAVDAANLGGRVASSFTSLKPKIIQNPEHIDIYNGDVVYYLVTGGLTQSEWVLQVDDDDDIIKNSMHNDEIRLIQFSINYLYNTEASEVDLCELIKSGNEDVELFFYRPSNYNDFKPTAGNDIRCEQIYTGYFTKGEQKDSITFFINSCYYQEVEIKNKNNI